VMEGPEAAYAQGDLYADVMAGPTQNTNGQVKIKKEEGEEFNSTAPVQPTTGRVMEYKSYTTVHPKSMEQQEKESKISANIDKSVRGKQLYVGGLTWWTTDEELSTGIQECGVNDLISIKFFENRVNGQSKGFALIEIGSETSQRLVAERLPNQSLHDQTPVVTFVNKQSLQMFENQAKKEISGLAEKREDRKAKPHNIPPGPQFITGFPPPGANVVAAPMGDHHHPNVLPQVLPFPPGGIPPGSIIVDHMGNVIQGVPGMNPPGMPPGFPPNSMNGPMHPLPPRPGVAPHINPAFIPPPSDGGAPPVDPMTGAPLQTAGMNEQDIESMRRNQAVASTAIQRAMTDANAGEFESGIETLVTAISLIKQSTTANTEPAQVLVQSLQDCLQGLEGQLVQKRPGSRPRHGEFERDFDRGRRRGGRRERSRSPRSRSRDRKSYSPRSPQHRSRSRDRRRR